MRHVTTFLLFLIGVMGGGISIGVLTAPGDWYAALQKPFFNPPNWIFGPVWTLLYLAIAYVGWRLWQQQEQTGLRRLWSLQMGLNFLWSPAFFAAQMPVLALVIILLLLGALLLFVRRAWQSDRILAVLFMPYVAWVGFATALNTAIVLLN
ncbi:MAG: sensor histidine kinase [Roseobacter sp. MedPE-SW]|nr:MAG: sensor histidine kinase [Roseobacter sp. MedPE-SW]